MKKTAYELTALRRLRTASEIDALLDDYRRSGLSLLAFARQRQLCYATLLRWNVALECSAPIRPATAGVYSLEIEPSSCSVDYVLS